MDNSDEIKNSTDEVLEINKAKKDFKIEMVLFFVLGVLLGITMKTEAIKRVTMGFNDYKINAAVNSYNVAEIKKKLIEEAQQKAEEKPTQQPSAQTNGSCQ